MNNAIPSRPADLPRGDWTEAAVRVLDAAVRHDPEALREAERIGYPVLIRPSYVLGGRAMQIVYDAASLTAFFAEAERVAPGHPVLIDRFLEDAFEADVDAIADGRRCVIGGVMQHIEGAGIHSGDSACVLPPYLMTEAQIDEMRRYTRAFADRLGVVGLLNVQYAIKDGAVYVLEVNPRASRTIPFVSKAIGVPLARLASLVMVGKQLDELGLFEEVTPKYYSVKESVFPFNKFLGVDIILGPEMRSTGEVMGVAADFPAAFAKAQAAAGARSPPVASWGRGRISGAGSPATPSMSRCGSCARSVSAAFRARCSMNTNAPARLSPRCIRRSGRLTPNRPSRPASRR